MQKKKAKNPGTTFTKTEGKPPTFASATLSIIEPDRARQAFEELKADIEAVPSTELIARQVDMQRAAAVAYTVAGRDAAPARRAEFEQLARIGRYSLALIERLSTLALASWHARRTQLQSQFRASSAAVPEDAVRAAQATRGRMLRVVDYWLGEDFAVARKLEYLKTGTGYLDLANDLAELAALYERDDLRARLVPGAPHYLATDLADARRHASALFISLGLGDESELERGAAMSQRAWALLVRTYEEHRSVGQFLFQKQEDVSITYPSLISAVRGAPTRRPVEVPGDEPVDEPGDEPSEGPVEEPVEEQA